MATYDPSKVIFSFAGSIITGFADGTFITVERNEDAFTLAVGASGEYARAKNANKSGRVTVTLMASSQANDILSAIAKADELTGVGNGILFVKELNGTTLAMSRDAWVLKMPNIERAKDEISPVEWVFECAELEMFAGGIL